MLCTFMDVSTKSASEENFECVSNFFFSNGAMHCRSHCSCATLSSRCRCARAAFHWPGSERLHLLSCHCQWGSASSICFLQSIIWPVACSRRCLFTQLRRAPVCCVLSSVFASCLHIANHRWSVEFDRDSFLVFIGMQDYRICHFAVSGARVQCTAVEWQIVQGAHDGGSRERVLL